MSILKNTPCVIRCKTCRLSRHTSAKLNPWIGYLGGCHVGAAQGELGAASTSLQQFSHNPREPQLRKAIQRGENHVSLCNDIISTRTPTWPEKVAYIGQIVRCCAWRKKQVATDAIMKMEYQSRREREAHVDHSSRVIRAFSRTALPSLYFWLCSKASSYFQPTA